MKAKVSLISWTKNPIELMCWARRVMHHPVPSSLDKIISNPKKWLGMEIDDYVQQILLKDGMPTFLEYVSFVFKLENVSRALTHQLVRHRIGFSFSQQSMRCVNLPEFATNHNYTEPEQGNKKLYHKTMLEIQKLYNNALKNGIPTQDARGLLPMNIHTTITFCCSFRALKEMINKRLCLKTQKEFRDVAAQIVNLIKKIDKRLLLWIGMPCKFGYCIMKGENEEQYRKNQLEGVQNTDKVCPIYLKKFISK